MDRGVSVKRQGEGGVRPHTVTVADRQKITLTGVEEVISFDEMGILLRTVLGVLSVDGEELHIETLRLDSGEVIATGKIGGILYLDGPVKKSGRRR